MSVFSASAKAVAALLKADVTLTALVPAARITEVVADDAAFPYIWIEDGGAVDWSTKTDAGVAAEFTLHVGSRYNGTKELREIGDALHGALHNTPVVLDAGECVVCQFDRYNVLVDQDGITRHGVFRFQLLISEG